MVTVYSGIDCLSRMAKVYCGLVCSLHPEGVVWKPRGDLFRVREMLTLLCSAPHVSCSIGGGLSEVVCRKRTARDALSEVLFGRSCVGGGVWEMLCGRCSAGDSLLST